LHGDEGAPDEDCAAIEEAGDGVADEEEEVGPDGVDVGGHVLVETAEEWLSVGFPGEERCVFV